MRDDEANPARRRTRLTLLACGLLVASACTRKSTPAPDKDPSPTATSAPTAAPTSSAAAPVEAIPSLVLEAFAPEGVRPDGLYAIEGALTVSDGQRVGRIVDRRIEWIGKIPKATEALGDNLLMGVVGRWPDSVAALYQTSTGRAPQPTYSPLGGKASRHVVAEGGGFGVICGVARVGESTLLASTSYTGFEIIGLRGPKLVRKPLTDKALHCKEGAFPRFRDDQEISALYPQVFESTPAGTLVALGDMCDERGLAAEIWDTSGQSRIVDVDRWWKKSNARLKLLKGSGDELFAFSDGFRPILRYHDGTFEPLPQLERPIQNVFVSPKGQVHAYDGQTIRRYEDGRWIAVARLAEPTRLGSVEIDEHDAMWAFTSGVFELRPGPAAPAEAACKSWFVYLYRVSYKSEINYTFPTTRKALSTFPEASSLGLLDFSDGNRRHLGVAVASKAQGEALVAHVKATMKDEDPKLFCYEPKAPRRIDF